jgi:intracellular sulfur oxidation DsrE/DsrF family protein
MNSALFNTVLQSLLFAGLAGVLVLLLLPVFTAWHSQPSVFPARHVLAVADSFSGTQSFAINRMKTLLKQHNGEAQLEIVALGDGVPLLAKDSPYHEDIMALLVDGVVISVCEKSLALNSARLGYSIELIDGVKLVKDGAQYAQLLKELGYKA